MEILGPQFWGGANIYSFDKLYTELEYIESSGTQYIDTGFIPNQDTRLVLDFEPISVDSTHLFGSRASNSSSDYFVTLVTSGYYRDDYYNDKSTTALTPDGRITIDKNKNTTTIDSTTSAHTYTTFSGSYPIYLFASNTGNTVSYYSSYKLYSCQIYDNGTLVRDFIPVQRFSDGAIGLYDKVTKTFFGNAGTSEFIAGPEITF